MYFMRRYMIKRMQKHMAFLEEKEKKEGANKWSLAYELPFILIIVNSSSVKALFTDIQAFSPFKYINFERTALRM